MAYQKTFAFDATQCPNVRSEFWQNVDASMRVSWGDCSIREFEFKNPVSENQVKAVLVTISAKTISHLAQCSYELAEEIAEFKAKHRNLHFYKVVIPGKFEQDEEENKNYRRKAAGSL